MKYRFVEQLNAFLNSMGRGDLVNSQLDCHSNIQLEMSDAPAINIDLSTDDLIIWCSLDECNHSRLDSSSAALLKNMLEYPPRNFYVGQPALSLAEDNLVLSAVLKTTSLDNMQLFADSFEEFFERANELRTQLS
ncbi:MULTISPECIES: type III secretion system protein [Providencia]|uniref:Type III secretion system protein n=3 Tax=Providencia alcalifaciens TaxID=126385 RepID=A0AAW9VE09_9GAMM|nr:MULTISPECIES: type III secretion system protein [Providencia]ATG15495.1 type III secretion system protein [Providencia alcalifaciens]EEB45336.1 invasion protein B family [Providencia alcalifaciens DSM 30120]EKT63471.1 type III secretion system protein [Providencia alcalifaciens Dmel2]ETT09150.1 invasion protein B family protein [Providencia alcalifaciens F90-2004]EUC97425.1 invasion protein B family protein [Providencia alcalifaciens PAL-2]